MTELFALMRLADEFDKRGLLREADFVDCLIRHAAEWSKLSSWLRKKYEHLKQLFSKKKNDSGAANKYDNAAGDRLDDMIRRKQSGPVDERLFLWFCNRFPNSCQECGDRQGRMRTLRQWREEGLPGSGVCTNGNCACRLLPLTPGGVLQMNEDGDFMAGAVGLQEDGLLSNMNQGFVLEPFFSNYGTLGQ